MRQRRQSLAVIGDGVEHRRFDQFERGHWAAVGPALGLRLLVDQAERRRGRPHGAAVADAQSQQRAGVAQLFANTDSSRRLWDTIVVAADPSSAAAELATTQRSYNGKVSGSWQPLAVGANGTMISGTSPDNSQAMTVLVFTEGKALVTLEFDSAPNDPIDPAFALDVGRKQDAAIKNGLPG